MASSGIIKSWVTSGSADFGDGDGVKSYSGAHYTFEWSATKHSDPGKTTVSYSVYRRGRNSSPTKLDNKLRLVVKDHNGTTLVNISNDNPGTKFTDVEYTSGSFTISHKTDGSASFTADFNVSIYTGTFHATSGTGTLDTNYPYTRCGAPTSVSASGIIVPSGSFTVSWSGATSGTSNTINGYDIYYLVSQNGTNPTTTNYTGKVSVSSTSASGSKSITLTNATRGYKVKCAIYTKGTAGASYYSASPGYGGNVTINSLPTAPSVTASTSVIPSTGGTVSITVTKGTDADSTQTLSRYYTTSNTFNKNNEITTTSVSLGEGTYYFWTFDGLEASSATTYTISKNSKPTVTISSVGSSLKSVNTVSGYSYVISPTITAAPGQNGQSTNTYTYGVRYGSSASSLSTSKEIASKQSSTSYSIADIRSIIGTTTSTRYYQLYVKRHDGKEDSSIVYDSTIYYVTKKPTFSRMYNKHYSTDVSGFSDCFLNELCVDLSWDEGYTSLILDTGTLQSSVGQLLQKNTSLMYANFSASHLTKFSRGSQYTFNMTVGYSSGYSFTITAPTSTTTTANTKRFRIRQSSINNLVCDATIKPFNTGNKIFTFYNQFGLSSVPDSAILKEYGLTSTTNYLSVYISGSGVGSTLSFTPNSTNIAFNGNDATLTLSATQFYNILPATVNKNAKVALKLNAYLTNAFGETSSIQERSFTADFVENPSLTSQGLYVSSSSDSTNVLSNWVYLKEGMPIVYTGSWKSYNSGVTGQVYVKRSYKTYPSGSLGDAYGSPFLFNAGTETLAPGSPRTYTLTNQAVQTIGQILEEDYTATFSIKVTTDAGSASQSTLYSSRPVKSHKVGLITLNSAAYDDTEGNEKISFTYQVADDGLTSIPAGFSVVAGIQSRTGGQDFGTNQTIWSTSNSVLTNTSGQISYDMNNINIVFIRIKIATTLYARKSGSTTNYYSTTYSTYSNEFAVYNILPTIAYRQNHLGINLTNFDGLENVILAIGAYSGKDSVYLKGTSHLARVDVDDGSMYGFIIDGGSW